MSAPEFRYTKTRSLPYGVLESVTTAVQCKGSVTTDYSEMTKEERERAIELEIEEQATQDYGEQKVYDLKEPANLLEWQIKLGIKKIDSADALMQLLVGCGVGDYTPVNEVNKEAACPRPETTINGREQSVYFNEKRYPKAALVWPFAVGLFNYAQEINYEPTPELVEMAKEHFKDDYRPGPKSKEIIKAKSATKTAGIIALNQAFYESTAKRQGSIVKVLAFGCGSGLNDLRRIVEANHGVGNLQVDLYDPKVPIKQNVRRINDRQVVQGKDYPMGENPDFPVGYYDIVLSMNSIHYNARPLGGKYSMIDRLFNSVASNGIVCGLFPSSVGSATVTNPPEYGSDFPRRSYIDMLATEMSKDGVPVMITRVFSEVYEEPVLEPSVLQGLLTQHGFVGQVFNGRDAHKILTNHYPGKVKFANSLKYPEVAAFNVFYARKTNFDIELSMPTGTYKSDNPILFDLEPGDNIAKYEEAYPKFTANYGRPMAGDDKWKFVNGGAWLVSEKTDGLTANCRCIGSHLYIFVPGMKVVKIPLATSIAVDISFQAEAMKEGDKWALTMIQLTAYKDTGYSFGSGLSLAFAMRNVTFLKGVHFKEWSVSIHDMAEKCAEGLVIMDYAAGPPEPVKGKIKPLDKIGGNAVYVKKVWTVDVEFQSGKSYNKLNDIVYSLPNGKTGPIIAEFALPGKFVRNRPDKDKGNSEKQAFKLSRAVKWKTFVKTLIPAYYYKWRPLTKQFKFLYQPMDTWTVSDMLLVAISYPKSITVIEEPKVRKEIYKIRKDLYDSKLLVSSMQSDDTRDRLMNVLKCYE